MAADDYRTALREGLGDISGLLDFATDDEKNRLYQLLWLELTYTGTGTGSGRLAGVIRSRIDLRGAVLRVGGPIRTRRPRWCCGRSWRWRGEQPGEGRYARCPSQRTVTPSSSATRNSGSPVSTGQSSTDAAPAAKASA